MQNVKPINQIKSLSRILPVKVTSGLPSFSMAQQKILIALALFMLVLIYFRFYSNLFFSSQEETLQEIAIEVKGEVLKPGVYLFQNPPTLREVIEKAGGLLEPARFDPPSFSEILQTGTLINVRKYSSQEIKVKIERMAANQLLVFSIPLDLNQVSINDLCLVPGIGESLAKEIVAYRERRRGFLSVEELKRVKGIGGKKYSSLKNFFIVHPQDKTGSPH